MNITEINEGKALLKVIDSWNTGIKLLLLPSDPAYDTAKEEVLNVLRAGSRAITATAAVNPVGIARKEGVKNASC